MGQINGNVLLLSLILVALFVIVSFRRWMVDALIDAINRFRGGGPPTPMHPSPAGDDVFLRKRSRKGANPL